MRATISELSLARSLMARAPAAAVLMEVRCVASMTAMGKPVSGSTRIRVAITVGSPLALFPGWEFTTLTPATPFPFRYAGIARTSPPGNGRISLGGIEANPIPFSRNASSTASKTSGKSSPSLTTSSGT